MAIFGSTTVTFAVLLEIALLGLATALLRVILIPCVKLPPNWEVFAFLGLADTIAIVFAVVFGWFTALPVGVYVVYGVYTALAYAMELLIKEPRL